MRWRDESLGVPRGTHPSPSVAHRSSSAGAAPPNQIGIGIGRARVDAGQLDAVELAVEVDHVVLPEQAHHLDLLGLAPPAIGEGLVERNELDGVPPSADAEAEPVARQHGELGGLLGDEHGLALGQDQDRRDQLEAPCDGGDEAEHRERLVERDVLVVGAFEAAGPLSLGADDVVVDEQVGRAELLRDPARRP